MQGTERHIGFFLILGSRRSQRSLLGEPASNRPLALSYAERQQAYSKVGRVGAFTRRPRPDRAQLDVNADGGAEGPMADRAAERAGRTFPIEALARTNQHSLTYADNTLVLKEFIGM
jgi:hypothetical protein